MAASEDGNRKRARTACKNFSSGEKQIIDNVYRGLKERNPDMLKDDVVKLCSSLTKVGVRSDKIIKEKNMSKDDQTVYQNVENQGPRGRKKIQLDDDTKNAILRVFHSYFFRNEIPTLKKISENLASDDSLPNISRAVLLRTLHEMNIRYLKRDRNSHLIEKEEIIVWRRKYLQELRQYRRDGRKIYFTDETWLNAGHIVSKVWQDLNIKSSKQAFMDGFSTGLKAPSGKGSRLIICHIGSDSGFVENGLLLFQSKKTGDYHEDMDSEKFETWFSQILGRLEPGSVVVMDNAPYHSRRLEVLPTTAWRKGDIIDWLSRKNIEHEANMLKTQLMNLARAHKQKYIKNAVDEMARERNIIIHRLPPYHCELNPIELIWAQVKNHVAKNKSTFKINDVRDSLLDVLSNHVSAESWKNCIRHTMKEEDKMWDLDTIMDVTVNPLIINVNPESDISSESDFSDSDN